MPIRRAVRERNPKNGPTFSEPAADLSDGPSSARSKFTMWIGLHRRRGSAAIQTLLRLGEADAAARFDDGVTLREFALVGGILGAQQVLQVIPTSLGKQTVIARSVATKQSSWIATARFAHLAMTSV